MATPNDNSQHDSTDFDLRRSVQMVKSDPKAAKSAFKAVAGEFCAFHGVTHRTVTPEQCADRRMSERSLQDKVVERAKRRGWKVAHAGRGIAAFDKEGKPIFITPMAKGWPDLFMLHPRHGAMVVELKREEGELEPEQIEWINAFNAAGIPAIVIRPSQLRDGTVNVILGAR